MATGRVVPAPPPRTLGPSTNRPWTTDVPPTPSQRGQRYHPAEVAKAFRDEHPGIFGDVDDSELLDALRDEDPDTYAMVDQSLLGAELLPGPTAPPPPPRLTPPSPRAGMIVPTALRVAPAVVGGGAGLLLGGPAGSYLGGAAGAGLGETAAQLYEQTFGEREAISPSTIALETGLGAINPAARGATVGRRILGQSLYGAGLGAVGGTGRSLIEQGRLPTAAEVAFQAGVGAATGGLFQGGFEAAGAVARRAPNLADVTGAPPIAGQPPPSPADLLPVAQAAAAQYQAEEARLAAGLSAAFGDPALRQPGQADYHTALQAKDYLEQLAKLNQAPVAIPPIQSSLVPADVGIGGPPPPRMLPESAGPGAGAPPGAFRALPPEATTPVELVGARAPYGRFVGGRDVAEIPPPPPTLQEIVDRIHGGVSEPGAPALVLRGQRVQPGVSRGTQTGLVELPTAGQEGPIRSPQFAELGGAPPTLEQPRLPGVTTPRPIDRTYATGPNAGPRREGELHGQPRRWRRRLKVGDTYTFEQAESPLRAEDPGTYPPEVRRELARMAWELESFTYESPRLQRAGARVVDRGYTRATPGAPVYHDILRDAAGARAHATRAEVLQELRAALREGKGSLISDAAAQTARKRIAGQLKRGSPEGAGDELIGWVDEATGQRTLPPQDLDEWQRMAREADDSEVIGAVRATERHGVPEDMEPAYTALREEAVRRGFITPDQLELRMLGPGGEGGPPLPAFEGEPRVPRTPEDMAGEPPPERLPEAGRTPEEIAAQRQRNEQLLAEQAREMGRIADIRGEAPPLPPPLVPRPEGPNVIPPSRYNAKGEAATFAGWQEGYGDIPDFPIFNIEGGPRHGSTVSPDDLVAMKIPFPDVPANPRTGARYELSQGSRVGQAPPVRVTGMETPGPGARPTARRPEDVSLPGLEGVRQIEIPHPPVAEAPLALTPPPPPRRTIAPRTGNLFKDLLREEGVLVFDIPAGDRQGLRKWLKQQEREHGGEAW